MPAGKEFIKHEYDEGIAIQEAIVAAAGELRDAHPMPAAKELITEQLAVDRRHLEELRALGAVHAANDVGEQLLERPVGSGLDVEARAA